METRVFGPAAPVMRTAMRNPRAPGTRKRPPAMERCVKWQLAAMENTLAATPKARLATLSTPAPALAPLLEPEPDALAFPVPPPANTARMMPTFAFPPLHDATNGPTRAEPVRPTRQTTVRVRVPRGQSPVADALATLAAWIESAPLPALPDDAWTFIGRAWFFIAGTTMGVVLALALIAASGRKAAAPREAHGAVAEGAARVLVVQRAASAPERDLGELAANDVEEVTPPPHAPVVARRPVYAARRPVSASRSSQSHVTKDILNAGL